jgi:hypothetical protein
MADSIRAALTNAFEKADAETPVPDQPAPESPTAEVPPAPPVEPKTDGVESSPDAPTAPVVAAKEPATTDTQKATVGAPPVIGAPASWKPAEKAEWDKVPESVRAAVMRRETETSRALSQSAEARKFSQRFEETIHPYRPLMDAYGVKDPVDAIGPLLATRAALEIGTPTQKAQLVANLIHQFGVDISALDNFLANGPQTPPQAPPVQPQNHFDPTQHPALQPLFSLAEQFKGYQQQKVEAAVAEVSSLEHFETVREDMADVLERAYKAGRVMTMQEAYNRAVAMNPDLEPVARPPTAVTTSEAAAILAKSRKAASSVSGAPKVTPSAKPVGIRAAIEAAMEEVG